MPTLVMISKKRPSQGLSPKEKGLRAAFVATYVILVGLMFWSPSFDIGMSKPLTAPRFFWTMALPLVPMGIVVAGFYPWRKVCPLAFWGQRGRALKKGKARRVPKWMEKHYPLLSLGLLATALAGRLVSTNGDGVALGVLLIGLGLAAFAVNLVYTGKTWCNFFCPVSIVERLYTEPNSLRREQNSQCTKCTACKKNCPDIDQENSYWKGTDEPSKRAAYYMFPGLVLAFYTYFWLREGDWEAYYGGGWTLPGDRIDLLMGPGFFFLPQVPAIVAAPVSIAVFMGVSFGIFAAIEAVWTKFGEHTEDTRHWVFTLAGFTAFNLFYVFAGAPTLRELPLGPHALAFAAPLVSTLFLVKRWRRSRKDFMEEKSAKKLLRNWKGDDPPPDDPASVFAFFKAQEQAKEHQLQVYREAVREALTDGVITDREKHLLEVLRAQLGVSDKDHRASVAAIAEEGADPLDPEKIVSVERQLQLEGYREALTGALLENAGERRLRDLRHAYDVEENVEARMVEELSGKTSPVHGKIRESLDRMDGTRDLLRALSPLRFTGSFEFVTFALGRAQGRALRSAVDAFPLVAGSPRKAAKMRAACIALMSRDDERRKAALDELEELLDPEIHARIAPVMKEPIPLVDELDEAKFHATLDTLLESPDPYLRAGAVHGIGLQGLKRFAEKLRETATDEDALVRETTIYAARRVPGTLDIPALKPLMSDRDAAIRRAAREAIESLDDLESRPTNPIRIIEGRTLPPIPDGTFSALSSIDKVLFLRCVPLFADLDPDDLHEVCRFASERTVRDGSEICAQGEASDDLYVIISGTAAVTVATRRSSLFLTRDEKEEALAEESARETEVAELGPGDVVGELAAIDQSPRSASVRPKSGEVRLLQIRGEDFRRRLAHRADVAPRIMATLTGRLRETLARLR